MRKYRMYTALFSWIFLMLACGPGAVETEVESASQSSFAADSLSIEDAFGQQLQAWNAGNIEGFMAYYLNSPDLQFITQKGRTIGWQNVLSNYQKSYPNKEAMGTLDFITDHYQTLSDSLMLSTGRWVVRKNDEERSGYFSLIWKEMRPGEWRIIVDHTW